MIQQSIATVLDDGIHIGRQPTHGDVQSLSFSGCRSILSLSHGDEAYRVLTRGMEAGWTHAFGMEHASVPVHPCVPQPEDVEAFLEAVERLPRPIFVHSVGGQRAIAFAIIHHALRTGKTAMQSHRWAAERGLALDSTDFYRFVVREVMRRQWREPEPLVGEGYQAGKSVSGKRTKAAR